MKEKINRQDLENNLDNILNQILPSNDFVEDLHRRLKAKTDIMVEYPNYLFTLVIIFSGLFLGIALLWVLNKMFKIVSGNKNINL